MEIISKAEAIASGKQFYFTGLLCKFGHLDRRRTNSGRCQSCERMRGLAHYREHAEEIKAKRRVPKKNADELAREKNLRDEAAKIRHRERSRAYYHANKDRAKATQANYRANNKKSITETKNRRIKERLKTDALFSIKHRVKCLIRNSFLKRGFGKSGKTESIIGCTWPEFAAHIERQFLPGMTWENRHLWHIDHIVPLDTAETETDVLALNHFTNLRPLWGKDNLAKSANVTHLI